MREPAERSDELPGAGSASARTTLRSMTGFSRVLGGSPDRQLSWSIEIRSVNARGLDLKLRLPTGFDGLEAPIRGVAARFVTRGACQIQLGLERSGGASLPRLNDAVLDHLYAQASAAAVRLGAGSVALGSLLTLPGVIETREQALTSDDIADLEAPILRDVESGLERMIAMREREGAALRRVLDERLHRIEALTVAADALPSRDPARVREKLGTQLQALLQDGPALDPQRLHQEAALIATRADIREEIDRLKAHVGAARDLLGAGEPVGRRLDFLAQELARESNTLCAKSNDIALTSIGLDLKTLVEQFREQVQNVE